MFQYQQRWIPTEIVNQTILGRLTKNLANWTKKGEVLGTTFLVLNFNELKIVEIHLTNLKMTWDYLNMRISEILLFLKIP